MKITCKCTNWPENTLLVDATSNVRESFDRENLELARSQHVDIICEKAMVFLLECFS